MKFIDVFAGWPGRSHDARIFRCSIIGQTIINNPSSILPNSCYILGDGAYPLAEGLMIPYKDNGNLSLKQKNFNHKLSSSRVLIEQAFGKLIGRFQKIKHMDLYKKNFCGKVITAACCLYNICISNNDTFDAAVPIQAELNLQEIRNEVISSTTKRNLICDTLSII
ncbi:uncharacterized protein LOC132936967 [Metopolophium dirhodum]|uniref:uncharacterized protein LOC132936967 n=1 Tax=Metopolophium dirhodum TaxID=44670 RepID=UPI0029907CD8|nr:uncharacterized protein LOC132936967 [Metopolophium dirhodum]